MQLDHTIIAVRDGERSARWFADPDDHLLEIITVPYGGVAKPS